MGEIDYHARAATGYFGMTSSIPKYTSFIP
jgi:hypothetical protein